MWIIIAFSCYNLTLIKRSSYEIAFLSEFLIMSVGSAPLLCVCFPIQPQIDSMWGPVSPQQKHQFVPGSLSLILLLAHCHRSKQTFFLWGVLLKLVNRLIIGSSSWRKKKKKKKLFTWLSLKTHEVMSLVEGLETAKGALRLGQGRLLTLAS